MKRRIPNFCLLLIIGAVFAVSSAALAEAASGRLETASPVTSAPADVDIERGAPGGQALDVPRLTPLSPGQMAALKAAAASDPDAQAGDPVRSPSGPEALTGDILASFTGLNRPSSANNGFVFFPPDTDVAKSNFRVIEVTNSAIRLFSTTGAVLATSNLNTFFARSLFNGRAFDPKVYYDRNASNRRFYVTALQKTATASRILLAISRSSDPVNLAPFTSWCIYDIDGRRNVGTTLASWADYPGLGAGADKLVLSHNNFTFSSNSFTFAIVRALNKLVASNNAAGCPSIPFHLFQPTGSSNNGSVFTLQPVKHYFSPSSFTGSTNPAYLINTQFGSSTLYRVWRVNGLAGVSAGTLSLVNTFGSFAYGVPPNAPQTGSAVLLDTGDNRVTEAAGNGNFLTAAHGTLCNLFGGATEACVRVVRFFVSQSGATPTAFISQQGTFGFPGEFYFWPGVAVNSVHQTAVSFQFVAPFLGGRLSGGFATKDSPTPLFTSFSPMTVGSCPQTASSRTGDYTGAQLDPTDLRSFWMATERATLISGVCQWETRIIHYDPGFDVIGFQPE